MRETFTGRELRLREGTWTREYGTPPPLGGHPTRWDDAAQVAGEVRTMLGAGANAAGKRFDAWWPRIKGWGAAICMRGFWVLCRVCEIVIAVVRVPLDVEAELAALRGGSSKQLVGSTRGQSHGETVDELSAGRAGAVRRLGSGVLAGRVSGSEVEAEEVES